MSNRIIDEYFLSFSDKVAFLELKEGVDGPLQKDLSGLPLPIRQFDFLEGVKRGDFEEKLDLVSFLRGMVWMQAIDPAFKHSGRYRKALDDYLGKPDDFALEMGREDLKAEEGEGSFSPWIKALIDFRAAYLLNPDNLFAAVQYAQLLWQVKEGGDRNPFVQKASEILEEVISKEEYHSDANAALGKLNEAMGRFVKAGSYYRRAMVRANDELVLEEIRANLNRISPDIAIENAIYFIRRADYRRAIEALMEAKAESNRFDLYYYLGVCYENIAQYSAAIEAFEQSIDQGADFAEVYNDYVFSLNAANRVDEALAVCDRALDLFPTDIRLRYNRAVLLTDRNRYEQALEDCLSILEFADLSDEMYNETMILRESILNRMKGD